MDDQAKPFASLPAAWERRDLGSLADFVNGRAFKPSDWSPAGTPIVRIQNLNGGTDFNYFEGEVDPRFNVECGDLLFSWSGTRGTSFGPHFWLGPAAILNQHIFNVRNLRGVEQHYLYYALKLITEDVAKRAHGGTGIVHITKGQLEAFEIPLPPLKEQRKIATIMSSVDDAIEATHAVIDQLQVVKKAMMAELLTRGLPGRHKKFKMTEVGEVPEEWEVRTFGDLCTKIVDGVHKKPAYVKDGVPFVTVKNLTTVDEGVSFSDLNYVTPDDHATFWRRANPERGDVLLTKDGTLGVPRVVDTDRTFSIFVTVALLKPRRDAVAPWFMRFALEAPPVAAHFGVVNAGLALKHIHLVDLRATPCPVPPLSEQEEICSVLRATGERISIERSKLERLVTLKTSLMSVLLTGEARVKLDEDAA